MSQALIETELMTHSVILSTEFEEIARNSADTSGAITEMVRRIANRMELDVCSIYVLEPDGKHLRLRATMGLNQSSVDHIRMRTSEGLAGLAAEQQQPVSVAEASAHPRFKYFPEAGEERYQSFLGIPLMDRGDLRGVLVVQTIEAREFTDTEFTLIASAAGALAPHIASLDSDYPAAPEHC